MDHETLKWGAIGVAVVAAFGRWIVPLVGRTLQNAMANATASGNVLATVQAERDGWKARAQELDSALQEFREEWADMKSKFDLMQYQLTESNALNSRLLAELKTYREQRNA